MNLMYIKMKPNKIIILLAILCLATNTIAWAIQK